MSAKIQFFLLSIVISLLANSADSIDKWKWLDVTDDSFNSFDAVDPKSKPLKDPAYSAQDPISRLLTDALYSAQDPESVEIDNNVISQTNETTSKKEIITGQPEIKNISKIENKVSLDKLGNTVTKVFKVSEKVTSIPITTRDVKTTIRTTTYEDGTIATKVTAVDTSENTTYKVTDRELIEKTLISTKVTPNIKKTWTTSVSDKKVITQNPSVSTTSVDEKIESMDINGSRVIDTYRTYTDVITTPTVVTTTKTTTEHTLWTDGKTTTRDITSSKDSPLTNIVSTKTRKEHIDKKTIPNIVGVDDVQEVTDQTVKGDPIVESDCVIREDRHKDNRKNIIIRISEVCKNTITVPITTIKTTTTKRNTLWTDGSTTSKIIDQHTEESTTYSTATDTTEKGRGSEIIEYRKLDEKESQNMLENYLNNTEHDPETLTGDRLEKLANLICQKYKAQGIEFTLSARFYGSDHNWNEPSGFEKLYDLVEKCLRD